MTTNRHYFITKEPLSYTKKIRLPADAILGTLHNNMGMTYWRMRKYDKALLSYEKAVEIRQKSVSLNYFHLAQSTHNTGLVYDNMGEYRKVLPFYEKAVELAKHTLPWNLDRFQNYQEALL